VRKGLDDDLVVDVLWSMNDPEYYLLLRSRGRTARQYADLLRGIWIRTLLR